jgi:hypothetical protein
MTYVSNTMRLAFSVTGTTTIVAAVEKTILLLINNTASNQTIAIKSVVQSLQADTVGPALFIGYIGKKTYTSGGVSITPTNFYTNSPNEINVSAYSNSSDDLALGGTDMEFGRIYMGISIPSEFNFDGAMILPPGCSIRATVTGILGATGGKIATEVIQYFMVDTNAIS